jgi:hypothetical protein
VTSTAPLLSRAAIARIAGALYALVIVVGIVSVGRIEAFLDPGGDAASTIGAVAQHAAQLRWALLGELLMYAMVVALALALYAVLRDVDRDLALLAAAWRVVEAIVGATFATLAAALPLHLAATSGAAPGRDALVPLLIEANPIGRDVVLLFMGLGATLFFVLFWRSRLVPRVLAGLGLLTYVAMIAITVVSLLVPGLSEGTKMLVYAPGGVFELAFGVWLLVRGVRSGDASPVAASPAP